MACMGVGFVWIGDLPVTSQPTIEQQVDCLNLVQKGFIALYANFDEDLCLIPKSPFYLEGVGGEFGNNLLHDVSLYISKIKLALIIPLYKHLMHLLAYSEPWFLSFSLIGKSMQISFGWVKRVCNFVAHTAAKLAICSNMSFYFNNDNLPTELVSACKPNYDYEINEEDDGSKISKDDVSEISEEDDVPEISEEHDVVEGDL
ncbi:hypothetical protein SO802_010976 [Lithocarpus litseifolius]|uniref:Uncharacterized protein n=1 Tax=Lithocarpus litseifolius TaxID=425828 RepID=A0AAW2DIT6_9ROSI